MHEKNLKFLGVSLVDQRNNSTTYRLVISKNFLYFLMKFQFDKELNFY